MQERCTAEPAADGGSPAGDGAACPQPAGKALRGWQQGRPAHATSASDRATLPVRALGEQQHWRTQPKAQAAMSPGELPPLPLSSTCLRCSICVIFRQVGSQQPNQRWMDGYHMQLCISGAQLKLSFIGCTEPQLCRPGGWPVRGKASNRSLRWRGMARMQHTTAHREGDSVHL